MYNVSDAAIEAFKADGVHKEFKITIRGVDYLNDQIVDDSFTLDQSILDSEQFEAIGCIASHFSVDLRAQFPTKIKGAGVKVFIKAENTEWIQLFEGLVDKCTKTANGWNRHIEAYDFLYNMSGQSGQETEDADKKYDITEWYNSHSSVSIDTLLGEVCSKFGITLKSGNKPLANGSITTTCGSVKKVTKLSALGLIKTIMQINACFGYVTEDGKFSWKYLVTESSEVGLLYPSAYTFPGPDTYTGSDPEREPGSGDKVVGEYESLEYQDFQMLPIDVVKVRNYEKDEKAGSYGSGLNSYIVQGNILILDKEASEKNIIAQNIYNALNDTYYVPFTSELPGLPYLQCGDQVSFWDYVGDYGSASIRRFYILSRTLTGGQHLKDSYSAEGNEYLHEFISGQENNTNVEEAIEEALEDYPNRDEVQEMIEQSGGGTTGIANIVSISPTDVPSNPDPLTLYCIQGECRLVEDIDFNDGSDEDEGEGDTP